MGVSEVPIIASGQSRTVRVYKDPMAIRNKNVLLSLPDEAALGPALSQMPLSQVQSVLRQEAEVADPGKVRLCAANACVDSETVDYTPVTLGMGEYVEEIPEDIARFVQSVAHPFQGMVPQVRRPDSFLLGDLHAMSSVEFENTVVRAASCIVSPLVYALCTEAVRRLREVCAMPDPDGEAASNNSGDTSPDGVKSHIEKTIDHLQHHRVTDPKQFGDLKKAVEQADRTSGQSNAAIGRAIRTMPANALKFSR